MITKNKSRKAHLFQNNPTNITAAKITAVSARVLKVCLFNATLKFVVVGIRMKRITGGKHDLFFCLDPCFPFNGDLFQELK